MRTIISGGGTGGHIYPAIAIANALKQKGVKDILFVGAKGKMEMEKVPAAGYEIEGLWISGFHRTRKWRNILFPLKLIWSLIKARKIIDRFNPEVVVGVGGYASGPILKIAQMKKIPTIIQEQNSYPGITNKLLAKNANRVLVAYEGLEKYLGTKNIALCGNPVRKDLLEVDKLKTEALDYFNLNRAKKTILIIGGSLGARSINKAVEQQHELIKSFENVQLIWQVGKIYMEEYKVGALANCEHVKMLSFIDRMDFAYGAADLVISRAGALSISELMIVGKPIILIPSPNVAEDHQSKNAMALVSKEAAVLIRDKEAGIKMIPQAVELLANEIAQKSLSENLKALAKPEATSLIIDEIIEAVRG